MAQYNEEHSISFVDTSSEEYKNYKNDETNPDPRKDTWSTWKLIPSARPYFAPPPVKGNLIDVPGGNGSINLSTVLTGYPIYSDRTGSFQFDIMNTNVDSRGSKYWSEIYSELMEFFHGKELVAILNDDRAFYYKGVLTIGDYSPDKVNSKITINYDVYPYKRDLVASNEPWLWDPFDFVTGFINDYTSDIELTSGGTTSIMLLGRGMPVCPTINCADNGVVLHVVQNISFPELDGRDFTLKSGDNVVPEFIIKDGPPPVLFTLKGTGKVTIFYRGGSL